MLEARGTGCLEVPTCAHVSLWDARAAVPAEESGHAAGLESVLQLPGIQDYPSLLPSPPIRCSLARGSVVIAHRDLQTREESYSQCRLCLNGNPEQFGKKGWGLFAKEGQLE